jgi:hypothetical protein
MRQQQADADADLAEHREELIAQAAKAVADWLMLLGVARSWPLSGNLFGRHEF